MRMAALLFWLCAAPVAAALPAETRTAMGGHWSVDLRPNLADPAYSKAMDLIIAPDGSITGSFYNSPILAGHAGGGQGRLCIAFRTTDGRGLYHSAACLVDGKMIGQTWSEGRNFVLPWTAER